MRAVLLAALLLGCASSPYDRAWVSESLRGGTGLTLRPDADDRAPRVPPGVTLADGLTAPEAVALALWNNAPFQAELSRLGVARADLADAGMLPNPTLAMLLPLGPRQLEAWLQWPIDALWQRSARVRAASLDVESVARGLVQSGLDLARDVRVAHADAWSAAERASIRTEALAAWRDIATLTDARVRAGDAAAFEALVAHRNAAAAEEAAARGEADATATRAQLEALVGHPLDRALSLQSGTPGDDVPQEAEALRVALAARPDVRAAELAVEAAGARAGWEHTRVLAVTARVDVFGGGFGGVATDVSGRAGAQVTLPVFNQNQGGIGRAEAEAQRAAWRCEALRRQVAADVRAGVARAQAARHALRTWRDEALPAAAEAAEAAHDAYTRGELPAQAWQEAVLQHVDARVRAVELAADVFRADATMARAMGREGDRR